MLSLYELPCVSKLVSDWFEGIATALDDNKNDSRWKNCTHVRDIHHLLRNLRTNQRRGQRQRQERQEQVPPRQRRRRKRVASKQKVSTKLVAAPALKSRPIEAICSYVYNTVHIQTASMFQLVWDTLKLRICKVWEDERWWLYFQKTYLSVSESNGALTACWWNGPLCPHYKPGITPSWQPAESCNSKFKRDVLNVKIEDSDAPEKSHTAIVEAIETAIRVWTSPLDTTDRSGEPMSLMASEAAGKVSLSGPLSPDSWMLQQQEGILVRRWGKNPTRLPTIQDIAQASEDCVIVINTEARVHVVMRVGVPAEVDRELAQGLLDSTRATVAELQPIWKHHNILVETENEDCRCVFGKCSSEQIHYKHNGQGFVVGNRAISSGDQRTFGAFFCLKDLAPETFAPAPRVTCAFCMTLSCL